MNITLVLLIANIASTLIKGAPLFNYWHFAWILPLELILYATIFVVFKHL